MTMSDEDPGNTEDRQGGSLEPEEMSQHPEQEHPVQDAHGGSVAPSLVDDTGHQVAQAPNAADE